jgi:predicted small secreted protein
MTRSHSGLRSRQKLDNRIIEPTLTRFTRNPMRKTILITAAAALLLSACNTVAGVGRDAQSAGKAVTKAAKK